MVLLVLLLIFVFLSKNSLPLNQNRLSGWIVEEVYSSITSLAILFVALIYLTLFISFLFWNLAFYQMFREHCKKIDLLPESTPHRRYKIKKLVFESISFHISVKE